MIINLATFLSWVIEPISNSLVLISDGLAISVTNFLKNLFPT